MWTQGRKIGKTLKNTSCRFNKKLLENVFITYLYGITASDDLTSRGQSKSKYTRKIIIDTTYLKNNARLLKVNEPVSNVAQQKVSLLYLRVTIFFLIKHQS